MRAAVVPMLSLAMCALLACTSLRHSKDATTATTAFVDFTVVPMDSARALSHQTVLVKDGVITAVGGVGAVRLPPNARRVPGQGRYLTPALADLHTHSADEHEMPLFVANGVTTILNMGWSPVDFVQVTRDEYSSGKRLGPVIFESRLVTWPWGGRPGIATRLQAREAVAQAKLAGFDFIKVYSFLTDTVFAEIVQRAHAVGLPLIGHVTYGIGVERALAADVRMIAHAEELLRGVERSDTATTSRHIAAFVRHGAWLTPTLANYEAISNSWGNRTRVDAYMSAPEAKYLRAERVAGWRGNGYQNLTGSATAQFERLVAITGEMQTRGVALLLGTDSPSIPGMVPGFAAHEELRMLQQAGLSKFDALATGTRNAGVFITRHVPGARPFGMIRPGYRADFIISERDPLSDLSTLREPLAVVRRGTIMWRAQLDSILASLRRN